MLGGLATGWLLVFGGIRSGGRVLGRTRAEGTALTTRRGCPGGGKAVAWWRAGGWLAVGWRLESGRWAAGWWGVGGALVAGRQ